MLLTLETKKIREERSRPRENAKPFGIPRTKAKVQFSFVRSSFIECYMYLLHTTYFNSAKSTITVEGDRSTMDDTKQEDNGDREKRPSSSPSSANEKSSCKKQKPSNALHAQLNKSFCLK